MRGQAGSKQSKKEAYSSRWALGCANPLRGVQFPARAPIARKGHKEKRKKGQK